MGMIRILTFGSFAKCGIDGEKCFSALSHGHADAVERAMIYLEHEVLPKAVARDVELAEQGDLPGLGFGPTVTAKIVGHSTYSEAPDDE